MKSNQNQTCLYRIKEVVLGKMEINYFPNHYIHYIYKNLLKEDKKKPFKFQHISYFIQIRQIRFAKRQNNFGFCWKIRKLYRQTVNYTNLRFPRHLLGWHQFEYARKLPVFSFLHQMLNCRGSALSLNC